MHGKRSVSPATPGVLISQQHWAICALLLISAALIASAYSAIRCGAGLSRDGGSGELA
jgi:hypothetical protein